MEWCCSCLGQVFPSLSLKTPLQIFPVSFSQSCQVDSHDSTGTWSASVTGFSTAADSLCTLGLRLGQDPGDGCGPPAPQCQAGGPPSFYLGSSGRIYHDCKFPVVNKQTNKHLILKLDRHGWRASGLLGLPVSPLPGSLWPQKPAIP